jgi:predicted DNA-binding transcriptional regulator AlpA
MKENQAPLEKGHGEKLSRKMTAAISALLSQPTIAKAAKVAGVSESTLWRWMQERDFQKAYREAQNKVFDGSLGTLQCATTSAVESLKRNLSCGNPNAEVAAARTILDFTMKARELIELTDKVSHLERVLNQRS